MSKSWWIFLLGFFPMSLGAQEKGLHEFVEIGTTLHSGDNTPLWQNALQHGLSSLDNNGYVRGAVFYRDTLGHHWSWSAGLDLAAGVGMDAAFVIQQAYADVSWRCFDLSVGSKELSSPFLNSELSSGGLVWSGNARPIPQVRVGIFDYIPVFRSSWFFIRGEFSYGWWTDSRYLADASEGIRWYTKKIKYHHKEVDFRFGKKDGAWQFDAAYRLDTQFGGYIMNHLNQTWFPDGLDLGNSLKDYGKVFFSAKGDGDGGGLEGERIARQGNFLGSEFLRLMYKDKKYRLSLYLENFFDDFSGMGKLNGFDGLWGLEYESTAPHALLKGLVFEYYQTTDQSGPLHGSDAEGGEKTGGADDYYNNYLYQGWTHWGQTMANPLIPSPAYFADCVVQSNWGKGYMGFPYNRVRAFHLGLHGDLAPRWGYRLKCSASRTWGTPLSPALEPLDNISAFIEAQYEPAFWRGLRIVSSLSFDSGDIYGDNFGWQLKLRKTF